VWGPEARGKEVKKSVVSLKSLRVIEDSTLLLPRKQRNLQKKRMVFLGIPCRGRRRGNKEELKARNEREFV